MNDIEVSSIDLVEGGNVFKQGHYLTLGYVPRDEKGETVDLSGKTLNVALWGRKGVVFEAAATYSAGVIRFTFDKLVAAGDYTVEFTATSSTDAKYRKKFPTNQHSGRIAIKQSADDLGVVGIQVYTVAQLKAEQKALLDAAVSGFTVDSETKMARVSGTTTHPTIGARLEADKQETAAQLADKASKEALSNVLDGSPKGTYATVAELQTAFPNGATGIYVISADGKWYFWNGSNWLAGGNYQAALSSFKNMLANSNVPTSITTAATNSRLFIGATGLWTVFTGYSTSFQTHDIISGRKYYAKLKIKPNAAASFNSQIRLYYSDGTIKSVTGVVNSDGTEIAAVILADKTGKANLSFSAGTVATYERVNQILVDLSEIFGLSFEPTKTDFEKILNEFPNSWFDTQTQFETVQKYLLRSFVKAANSTGGGTSFVDSDTGKTYNYQLKQKDGFVIFNYEEAQ